MSDTPAIRCMYKNNRTINGTFKDSTGTAVDLTGAQLFFTVKKITDIDEIDALDEKALLQKEITNITPLEGKFTLNITPADTVQIGFGSFNYDVKIIRSEESQYTIQRGVISIEKVVTQK